MSDCIFCKIIAGEIPSATIYENDEFKVILDRFPSGEGHALILPKNHVPNVFEIDPAQAGSIRIGGKAGKSHEGSAWLHRYEYPAE